MKSACKINLGLTHLEIDDSYGKTSFAEFEIKNTVYQNKRIYLKAEVNLSTEPEVSTSKDWQQPKMELKSTVPKK